MRLGTKILLLTLAATLFLSGLVVLVVGREVRSAEAAHARADIGRDADDYFARLAIDHDRIVEKVRGALEDPNLRSYMELSDDAGQLTPDARAQFEGVFFPVDAQTQLTLPGVRPAFHLLLGPR